MRIFFIALAFILAAALPAQAAKVLNVEKLTTPKGIEVWFVHDETVPVISINFSFEGGLALDPVDKPGVGRIVSILLDEGAGEMKSQQFQSLLDANAINIGFTAGRDAFYGELKTLSATKNLAFDLLRQALSAPRFDNDAVERMRSANIARIRQDMTDPSWLIARTFNGMAFEGHPYGIPGFGTPESMEKITRKDLQTFVHRQFTRESLRVAIAGDISAADAITMTDSVFGGLPEKIFETSAKDVTVGYAGKTILLPLDAPQTYVMAGAPGMKRNDRDWHAAVILNYVLGGGEFDSRLMHEIREKRGLTYGVYTALSSMKYSTLLQASFSASSEKAAEAVTILKQEWEKMAKEGVSAQELADAKAYLTGSLLLELTSTGDIAGTLNGLQRDDLDYNYINKRNDEIESVSLSDVKRVAAKLMDPNLLTIVLVGQPKGMSADIMLDVPPGMNLSAPKP